MTDSKYWSSPTTAPIANNGTIYDLGGNRCGDAGCGGTLTGSQTVFPLLAGATTQLGQRQILVQAQAPTFAVTGFGTSPTVTVQTGATDAAGAAIITAGTTPAATGTFTLTFSTTNGAYGTNPALCTFTLINGTGTWGNQSQEPIVTATSTTAVTASWNNFVSGTATALTATSTYGFNWSCYGH